MKFLYFLYPKYDNKSPSSDDVPVLELEEFDFFFVSITSKSMLIWIDIIIKSECLKQMTVFLVCLSKGILTFVGYSTSKPFLTKCLRNSIRIIEKNKT